MELPQGSSKIKKTMKKIFMIFALCAAVVTVNARETVEGSKFFDNWSVGIAGGVYTPLEGHAFFGSMRPTVNLTIAKQLTTVYGLGIEGVGIFNGTKVTGIHSANAFDGETVTLFNYFNLNNWFSGYKGEPRLLEVVAKFGLGWGHESVANAKDYNFALMKTGLDFNFNVTPALQINIKPAVIWNLEGGHYHGDAAEGQYVFEGTNTVQETEYNSVKNSINHAAFEITAGLTYKFRNSNGTHNFKVARLYDQAEVDGLNAQINDLRGNVNRLNGELGNKDQQIKNLQNQLNDCRNNQKPQTITKTVYDGGSMVSFRQGKSVIDASQRANVERVATYLKNHSDAKVVVEGYASPEGNKAFNEKLAQKRADAVKNMLVKKYKISADRITAVGKGIGKMFSEPDWNRVSISTIQK